jgi:hypothetical protein
MSKLLVLTGYAGCGKGAAADWLVGECGWERVKMAGALKHMLRAMYEYAGLRAKEIDRRIEGDLKEGSDAVLCGATPRHAMLTLGTEWGRDMIDESLWVRLAAARVQRLMADGVHVVVDDCRFLNEAEMLWGLGAKFVRIERDEVKAIAHESERYVEQLPCDFRVDNRGSLEGLWKQIEDITRGM